MAKNGELTNVQRRMIAALMTNRTLGAACEAVGIGRSTLARWLADKHFTQALTEAEGEAMHDTARSLLAGKETALETIFRLMTEAGSDNVKRLAAVDWLTFMHKTYELQTMEERLTALEKAVQK